MPCGRVSRQDKRPEHGGARERTAAETYEHGGGVGGWTGAAQVASEAVGHGAGTLMLHTSGRTGCLPASAALKGRAKVSLPVAALLLYLHGCPPSTYHLTYSVYRAVHLAVYLAIRLQYRPSYPPLHVLA